jgi:site-specific DNA-methyltransferase (adenine-specific)
MTTPLDVIYNEECLAGMSRLPDNSIDMVLADLPYGTTQNKWDSVIAFDGLWSCYRRILKTSGVVVLTASQPFSSALVMSNPGWFRYEWIWRKNSPTGHLNAHKQPMREHEVVLVFSPQVATYNPQGLKLFQKLKNRGKKGNTDNYGSFGNENFQEFTNYPRSIIEFETDSPKLHPTQKPVALFEYIIKTYSHPGETVLDNCIGSGTTAIACINSNRRYIGFERDEKYFQIAQDRIAKHSVNRQLPLEAA